MQRVVFIQVPCLFNTSFIHYVILYVLIILYVYHVIFYVLIIYTLPLSEYSPLLNVFHLWYISGVASVSVHLLHDLKDFRHVRI